MPAIVAHHLFGEEAYAKLLPVIGEGDAIRDAFLLGNQGPDPLFCLKALPSCAGYRDLGTVMHTRAPALLLASIHQHFIETPDDARLATRVSYALGFLCHYILDSTAHPLIYAQQFAFCDAGVPGLDRQHNSRETHALIETELDEYLLTTRRAATVDTFSPHRETLACPNDVLADVSEQMARVANDAYGMTVPSLAFKSSVKLYRIGQAAIDSKRDGLRRHVDYAKLIRKGYAHVQALTHTATPRFDSPFANNSHFSWPHPFESGKTINASFDELYDIALDAAIATVPQFACADFSAADCAELARDINFRGERV